MSADELAGTLRQALIALGALFVIVNLRVSYELAAWLRLRRDRMLTWIVKAGHCWVREVLDHAKWLRGGWNLRHRHRT